MILDGESMGASIGVMSFGSKALNPITLTKDELLKRGLPESYLNARYYDEPLQFIEPWSLTPAPANQYVTTVTVLSKDICEPCVKARAEWYLQKGICKTMDEAMGRSRHFFETYNKKDLKQQEEKCEEGEVWDAELDKCVPSPAPEDMRGQEAEITKDLQVDLEMIMQRHWPKKKVSKPTSDTNHCHGACCTFMTQWETRKDPDLKKYMQLHGVEIKETLKGLWLKLPVPCKAFDPNTKRCKVHATRPNICRNYPRHESPFIAKENCSLLMWKMKNS